jgi:hypothetical protein
VVRKAKVELEADVAKFIPGMEGAAKATDNVRDKVKDTDEQLKKIPPDAAKASAAMKLLGEDAGRAGLKLQDLGKSSTSMGMLDQRILRTRGELKRLSEEFDRTGNAGTLRQIFKSGDELKDLERLRKRLAGALTEGGQEGSKGVLAAMQGVLGTPVLGPITAGALIAGAVIAAPLVGAALGGAVSGAFALGGIFAGALTELKTDARVQAAGHDFLAWLGSEWKQGTASFAGPLMDAFSILKTDLAGPLRDLRQDFSYLAPYVRDFAMYLGAAAEKFMPGFNRMIQSSGPILTELGHGIVMVADGLNIMFDEISKGGKGEVEALDVTFRVLGGTLAAVGFFVRAMANSFDWITQVEAKVTDFQQSVFGWIPLLGDYFRKAHEIWSGVANSFDDAGPSISVVARSVNEVVNSLDDLARASDAWKDVNAGLSLVTQTATALPVVLDGVSHAMHGTAIGMVTDLDKVDITMNQLAGQLEQQVFGAIMGVAQANIAWHQSLLGVNEAVKQNGTTLKDNTKEGLANQLAVLGMVQANEQVYQANIASGMSADQARQAYEQNHDTMVKGAISAGFNAKEVHGLTDAYRGVPGTAQTEIIAKGLRSVVDAINDLIWQLALLDGKSATVDVYYRTHGMPAPSSGSSQLNFMAHGGIRKAAMGMFIPPSDPGTVLTGEPQTGGEVLIPMRGASNAAALGQMALGGYGLDVVPRGHRAGGWSGASVTNINLTVNAGMGTDGYRVGRQVAAALRPFVERSGGSVQQAVMRRS